VLLEHLEEVLDDLPRAGAVAAVERGLSAAGLAVVEVDAAARARQDPGGGSARFGPELVDQAGDEEGDLQGEVQLGRW